MSRPQDSSPSASTPHDSFKGILARVYLPAKAKLIEIRNATEKEVLEGDDVFHAFHDFASINRMLGEESKTVDLFLILEENDREMAKRVIDIAKPALLKAGRFDLCSKFVDPNKDYPRLVKMYRMEMRLADEEDSGPHKIESAEKRFSNKVATLVALLALSERDAEAKEIAADAKMVWSNEQFAEALDEALQGEVPEPWP